MDNTYFSFDATLDRLFNKPRPFVFTNGVFDILHSGHVKYLKEAANLGTSLIVGVNSDKSVRMLNKGNDRPVNNEQDRALIVSELKCVSQVFLFNEATPLAIIEKIKPDIYVKGGDYNINTTLEKQLMDRLGGKSYSLSYKKGYSTTELIKKIRSR